MAKMRKNISAYAGPAGDRNDCAVRALSVADGMAYKDAHAAFAAQGRKAGQGTSVSVSRRVLKIAGFYEVTVVPVPAKFPKRPNHFVQPSIAKFAREHKEGAWILHTSSHALALVNGVVHDWNYGAGSHGRVVRAWRK